MKNTIRMWDTYMAEGQSGFSEFHLYVCAAFLVKWSEQLQKMDFQVRAFPFRYPEPDGVIDDVFALGRA